MDTHSPLSLLLPDAMMQVSRETELDRFVGCLDHLPLVFSNNCQIGADSGLFPNTQNVITNLRGHHGAVDQTTITTQPPTEVMAHVKKILEGMGVEIQLESEYKYRCIRAKKRKNAVGSSTVAAAGPTTSLADDGWECCLKWGQLFYQFHGSVCFVP